MEEILNGGKGIIRRNTDPDPIGFRPFMPDPLPDPRLQKSIY
jgi:hypothetical protein